MARGKMQKTKKTMLSNVTPKAITFKILKTKGKRSFIEL
jgi:hypothetical protein